MYEISKTRLLQIAKDSPKSKVKIKQWYPDVFDFKKGWYSFDSGVYKYNVYLKDDDNLTGYGTMNDDWSSLLAVDLSWNAKRINNEDVLELLVGIGKKNHGIPDDENTTLWTYNEEEDSIKNGEGLVVYFKGGWHLSLTSTGSNSWQGEGWYKHVWNYSQISIAIGYIYLRNQEDRTGYGFYNDEWRSTVFSERANSVTRCTDREMRSIMIQKAREYNYTRENIVSLGGDSSFNPNLDSWTFCSNTLYAESDGNGGVIVYENGVWASKR